jgi:DDE superfamily endonuclease
MEDVLDLYASTHSDDEPLVCMDEASKQLLKDVTAPIPLASGRPVREDYHYDRRGTQSIFCFFDPIRGWRRMAVKDSRTAVDWAEQIRMLLEVDYPQAKKVKLVCDNLNTHTTAALYEAFPAEQARALAKRLEIHYTPVHGSWLNVAEIELSVLAKQCLDRRIGSSEELKQEVAAWVKKRNVDQSGVKWRFTTAEARVKLRHLYPQNKS